MSKDRYHDISDKELLQRFRQTEDSEWLGALLERYTLLLFGVCMKYLKEENDARDCVQQIFLKVIQEAGRYEINYFKSWLYMVAKNQCLTILRDRKGKTPVALTDLNAPLADSDNSPQPLSDEVTSELLEAALKELNSEQYNCVTLFYLKKNTYQQVSEITGYPLLKVKSHIQNGKRNLRISIQKKLAQNATRDAG
ncbi:RNA polymerase sigma factor [Niabella insulamsoli]|uniref:RNA polymerase sigma factor n=1 Tax=Niabella insulamsoli TaxID=3144874 RepID=UPI0031FE3DDA